MSEESFETENSPGLTNEWIGKSIWEEVTSIAEDNLKNNGFVFMPETGVYYNFNQKCYYCPDRKIYYYVDLEAYYTYDEETASLKFYSYSSKQNENLTMKEDIQRTNSDKDEILDNGDLPEAPCLRLIVTSSELAEKSLGRTFVVTSYGASLGRSDKLEISLPDKLISKIHSKFYYTFSEGKYSYEIEDTESRNGTYVDNKKIDSNVSVPLTHGSIITVGSTQLLCHIHHMYDICKECSLTACSENKQLYPSRKETLWKEYKSELSHLKKKFGIDNFIPTRFPSIYVDRAEIRRITKGSSCEHEKTQVASIHEPIPSNNKGYILLKKMGWSEDQQLNKHFN